MINLIFRCTTQGLHLLVMAALLSWQIAVMADDGCEPSGEYGFVCGMKNAEDLVLIPDTKWIIASGMAPEAAIYLVNSEQKTWTELYPAEAPRAEQHMAVFGACPGSPDPNAFVSHGLSLRPGGEGYSTSGLLRVVREPLPCWPLTHKRCRAKLWPAARPTRGSVTLRWGCRWARRSGSGALQETASPTNRQNKVERMVFYFIPRAGR